MARVVLINPDPQPRVLPPLGISYLAENLLKYGHEPRILDMGFDQTLDLSGADLVGITATTLTYHDACGLIDRIHQMCPDLPVILGGAHPSVLPELVLEDSGADAVVVGEGEEVMVDLAGGRLKPEGIIHAPVIKDLDALPYPTYRMLDMRRYFKFPGADRIRWSLKQPSIAMIGIRGCPFQCTFCGSKELFGKKVRYRSVENVLAEIDYLCDAYAIRSVYFYDDTFTLKRPWIESLCTGLAERRMEWICGTRVDMVDAALLQTMKASGCKYISYGIESGSDRMLKQVIKKGITVDMVREATALTRRVGIGIIVNYMFGLPGETEADMQATLDLIREIPANAAELSIFIPLPGAELAEGLDWRQYTSGKNPYHSPSRVLDPDFAGIVDQYYRKAVKAFYFSPGYMARRLGMIVRPKQIYYAAKSLKRLLRDIAKSRTA